MARVVHQEKMKKWQFVTPGEGAGSYKRPAFLLRGDFFDVSVSALPAVSGWGSGIRKRSEGDD